MKNNKSMWRQFILIPLILISCALLFTACVEKGPVVTEISIQPSEKPQTVFVKGQDLDLSAGKLTVTLDDGTKQSLALNDASVTVTGYDKETVGDQNLTITYGEKSITLAVSVVNRMTFSGYEKQYFVGDTFNTDKGSVTIVKNDGSKINVRLNDKTISVVSFDSSAAGTQKVNIRYASGAEEYTDSLDVTVYGVGSVKFYKPNKTNYGSHETQMSYAGGYFQVTAEGNESKIKFVDITDEMVSGFNPAAATKDNIDTPLKQAITINYAGNDYMFEISITYSGVSLMNDAINALKDLDLDAEGVRVTEAQGKIALEALQAYMKLTPAERGNVSEADTVKIARVAAMHGNAYANVLANVFSDAVLMQDGGIALVMTATRESIEKAIEMLSDPKNEFVEFSLFLEEFAAEFAKVQVNKDETVADVVKFVSEENLTYLISILESMVQLHEDMVDIPDNWTVESLPDYKSEIETAVRHVRNFENAGLLPSACKIVSSWRTNDDYLRIIYAYYLNYAEDKFVETLWQQVPMPGELQNLYTYVALAVQESMKMQQNGSNALWYDASVFYYYYNKSLEKAEEIKKSDDELCKQIFEFINFDQVIKNQLTLASVGYVNLATSLYNDPQYISLMNKYLEILDKYMDTERGVDLEADKELLQALMDEFVAMSPSKQRAFLNSLFYLYSSQPVHDNQIFEFPENKVRGLYIYFLVVYYDHYLPDSGMPILQDLLIAMEHYLNVNTFDDAMSNFLTKMESVILAYGTLSSSDKQVFDQYLGNAYQKYLKLYQINKAGTPSDISKFEAKRDEFLKALEDYSTLRAGLADEEGKLQEGMMGALMTAYEQLMTLANELRNSDDEQLRALVYTMDVSFSEESSLPIDFAASNLRWNYIVLMHQITYTITHDDETTETISGWDLYSIYEGVPFHAKALHVIMQQYKGTTDFDEAKVLEAMKNFRAQIDKYPDALQIFYTFDADFYYNAGLKSFFAKVLTAGNSALGTKLLEVEDLYSKYARTESDEDKAAFQTAMAEAIALFASVTDTENFNTYLADMYNFYLEKYNGLNTAA